jgi:hypothetical protein
MDGEPGLRVIREVKAFRGRDDLWFGLPYLPCLFVFAITALLALYYEQWTAALVFFLATTIPAKLLAAREPYWAELFFRFVLLPKILGP